MKKEAFIAGIIISIAMVPFAASALSIDEIQQQIRDLLARVATLQAQLKVQAQASSTTVSSDTSLSYKSPRICGIIKRNLAPGYSGDDVRGLQEFLSEEGYLSASATGYFGVLTRAAVAKWQAENGVSAVGSVGPITRERILLRCGNQYGFRVTPQAGNAPLTVTAYANVGGFSLYRYAIDFGDGSARESVSCNAPADACIEPGKVEHTYANDGAYTIALWRTDSTSGTSIVLAKESVRVGGPIACTKEYMPVCGAKQVVCITTPCNPIPTTYGNSCMMKADGATHLYDGACKDTDENPESNPQCKAWFDGCNSCGRSEPGGPAYCTLKYCAQDTTAKPYCTAYFDDTTANKPPVISSFSGPVQLSVNEIGTWKITASDPENGVLKYSVLWGDEWTVSDASTRSTAPAASVQQDTSFTHSYSRAGTYKVSLTVTDSGGKEARSTATVSVSQTACTDQYEPVCGRPQGCANTCPPGAYCTLVCQLHEPQTYSSRCQLNNSNAEFLHYGVCTGAETY